MLNRSRLVPDRPAWRTFAAFTIVLLPSVGTLIWLRPNPIVISLCAIAMTFYLLAAAKVTQGAWFWHSRPDYAAATSAFAAAVAQLRPAPHTYDNPRQSLVLVRTRHRRSRISLQTLEVLWTFDRADLERIHSAVEGQTSKPPAVAAKYMFTRHSAVWMTHEALSVAVHEDGSLIGMEIPGAPLLSTRGALHQSQESGAIYASGPELEAAARVIRDSTSMVASA